MNFLRENDADFECSFDCNGNGELQSILDYFIQTFSNGLQRRGRKRGKFLSSLVNNTSKQSRQVRKKH